MDPKPLALITGASSGIGRETAIVLAQKHYRVIACARRQERLEQIAAEHPGVEPLSLDLTDSRQMDRFCSRIRQWTQPVDVLINNAGYGVRGMIEEAPLEAIRRMYDVNLFGACRMIQACMPGMRRARQGWIFNISSVSGKFVWPGNGYYASSKFALEGVTDALRHEAAPFGIKVVAIRPGPIATEFGQVATRMTPDWSAQGDPEYGPLQQKITDFFTRVTQGGGVPEPRVVAQLILKVLQEPQPLPAYAVGPMTTEEFATRVKSDEVGWRDFIDEQLDIKGMKL